MPHKLKYRILGEQLAVCRAAPKTLIPQWAEESSFFCVVRTSNELSVVCSEGHFEKNPPNWTIERGWIALQLKGPFPFSMTGVLASFLQPLADACIPIFAISTFDTDYVLVKHDDLSNAEAALKAAGTRIGRLTNAPQLKSSKTPFNRLFPQTNPPNWTIQPSKC